MTYSRRQIGWLTGGLPLVIALGIAAVVGVMADARVALLVASLGAVIALLFGSLNVTVDEEAVRLAFGIGLVRKRVLLNEIRSARVVRTPWWAGWGIRLVSGGWLYNVAGRQALELNYVDGGRILVGTDDPAGLLAALRTRGVPDANAQLAEVGESPAFLRWAPLVFLVPIACLVSVVFFIGSRPPTVTVRGDVITIQHSRDIVSLARQTATISLETTLPAIGQKLSGFNLGDTLRGRFRLADGTSVHLFVNRDAPPFIRVQHGERVVFVNFDDPDQTRRVYETLK